MGEHNIKVATAIEPSESFFWNKEYIERFLQNTKLSSKEGDSWIPLQKVGNFTESFLKAIVRPKQENFVTGAKLNLSFIHSFIHSILMMNRALNHLLRST